MRIRHLITTSIVCLSITVAAARLRAADGLYSIWECLENRTCHNYPAAYQSVRDIDFRNFSIRLAGETKDVRLSNGHYADEAGRVDLIAVHYLPPNSAGEEHVLLELTGQGTESTPHAEWIAQVLQFSKHQWTVIQQFSADPHNPDHPAFSHAFDESTKTLVLRFDRLADEHQCGAATGSCAVNYKWNGSRLFHLPSLRQN
jgi:hypothetical protein